MFIATPFDKFISSHAKLLIDKIKYMENRSLEKTQKLGHYTNNVTFDDIR